MSTDLFRFPFYLPEKWKPERQKKFFFLFSSVARFFKMSPNFGLKLALVACGQATTFFEKFKSLTDRIACGKQNGAKSCSKTE